MTKTNTDKQSDNEFIIGSKESISFIIKNMTTNSMGNHIYSDNVKFPNCVKNILDKYEGDFTKEKSKELESIKEEDLTNQSIINKPVSNKEKSKESDNFEEESDLKENTELKKGENATETEMNNKPTSTFNDLEETFTKKEEGNTNIQNSVCVITGFNESEDVEFSFILYKDKENFFLTKEDLYKIKPVVEDNQEENDFLKKKILETQMNDNEVFFDEIMVLFAHISATIQYNIALSEDNYQKIFKQYYEFFSKFKWFSSYETFAKQNKYKKRLLSENEKSNLILFMNSIKRLSEINFSDFFDDPTNKIYHSEDHLLAYLDLYHDQIKNQLDQLTAGKKFSKVLITLYSHCLCCPKCLSTTNEISKKIKGFFDKQDLNFATIYAASEITHNYHSNINNIKEIDEIEVENYQIKVKMNDSYFEHMKEVTLEFYPSTKDMIYHIKCNKLPLITLSKDDEGKLSYLFQFKHLNDTFKVKNNSLSAKDIISIISSYKNSMKSMSSNTESFKKSEKKESKREKGEKEEKEEKEEM